MNKCIQNLQQRALCHDQSKLVEPELSGFNELTPTLSKITFGSPEYAESMQKLKPYLDHHYANNSHHPNFYKNGIRGMTLMDIVEMLMDWKAASLRHNDGDILKSIDINAKRFHFETFDLAECFRNTLKELGI